MVLTDQPTHLEAEHFGVFRKRITKGVIRPVAIVLLLPYMWGPHVSHNS